MLHARLLLSPVARANVVGLDASRALALPGVIAVFSHLNAPAALYSRYRILPGQALCPEDETLFTATARFVGDRVAAVVATDAQTAADAVALIDVDYEELPELLTPEAALHEGAPPIHPGGNLLHEFDQTVGEPIERAADAVTVTTTVATPRLHHAAIEPHLCLADYDESGKTHHLESHAERLRSTHGGGRPLRPELQPRAGDQGAHGRLVWRQAGVHSRARDRLHGDGDKTARSSSSSTARSACAGTMVRPADRVARLGGRDARRGASETSTSTPSSTPAPTPRARPTTPARWRTSSLACTACRTTITTPGWPTRRPR